MADWNGRFNTLKPGSLVDCVLNNGEIVRATVQKRTDRFMVDRTGQLMLRSTGELGIFFASVKQLTGTEAANG